MSFLSELKRRNIHRVAAAYAVVAWLVVQGTSVFAPALNLPEWPMRLLALLGLIGFPVALTVAWLYELTPQGLKLAADVPLEPSTRRVTAQKLNYLIIGALVVTVIFLGVDNYRSRAGTATPAAATAPSGADAAPVSDVLPNSVAVLPFANMSPNPDDAYFAQGIHEEVLNQLAKIGALNVIARTSVLRYAESTMAIPDIARELNVGTVMEGSVRYAGDDVRITAQLIDPKTGAHVWSEAYQRKIDDIFAIQADIAMNIANALRAEFSLEEQPAIETPPTVSPEAYALYLQAIDVPALNAASRALRHDLLDRAIARSRSGISPSATRNGRSRTSRTWRRKLVTTSPTPAT
jgi:TolB-like protein